MERVRAAKRSKESIDRDDSSRSTSGASLESSDPSSSSSAAEQMGPSSLDESFSMRLNVRVKSDSESDSNVDESADFTSTLAQHFFFMTGSNSSPRTVS